MIGSSQRIAVVCVSCAAWICSLIALASADDRGGQSMLLAAPRTAAAAPKTAAPVDALRALANARREAERLVANDDLGRRIELSVAPALQARVQRILAEYQVPYAALVAIEPTSGRILAYVSHSSANPDGPDLARDPTPPAASVFKLVTSAALLDAGVTTDTRVCYGGGASRLEPIDLLDDARRDRSCASLADGLGGSINVVFAKLADRHLDPTTLQRYAGLFGFGQKLSSAAALTPSPFDIPSDRMEFARTAAGFWHVHMSPLHAALIAAMLANDGLMPSATLVDRVIGADGRVQAAGRAAAPRSVLSAATARGVAQMMLRTVRSGTARNAFFDPHGRPLLPGIEVAGKTGSLSGSEPYRAYSWWVGFAPANKPTIALAALIVNTANWRIKSSFLAREALHEYLLAKPAPAFAGPAGSAPAVVKVFARCGGAESCARGPVRTP
jgi:cell division protein FtsI/penicillin-binding protein 2